MEDKVVNPNEENLNEEEVQEQPVEAPAEEQVVEEQQEEQPKAKKSLKERLNIKMPKFVGGNVFLFIFISVLTVIGGLILFLCDENNGFRNKMGIKPEHIAWLRNIFKIDVSIITYLIFIIIAASVFFVFFALLFTRKIKGGIEKKRVKKTGQAFSKKGNTIYNVVYWSIFGAIALAVVIAVIIIFSSMGGAGFAARFNEYRGFGFLKVFGRFIGTIGVLLLCIAALPVLAILLYLLYRLAILLFGGLAGGVAKNVMQSSNFQETYAAAQAASNKINEVANQLPKTISVIADGNSYIPAAGGNGTGNGGKSSLGQSSYDGILFPALDVIDQKYANKEEQEEQKEEAPKAKKQNLSHLVDEFQSYLVAEEKLYFSKDVLRTFIAGLSASRLLLLEGLSGTGKSSLPRKFQEFIGGRSCFLQVQATWRDRTDVIGYFSDLTGYYKETELLKSIYESSYTPHEVNLVVLDEMNISRAEYYFADFLSIYEYPSEAWKIQLMQTSSEMKLPKLLNGGTLQLPTNIWFVGTINVDDSTFTVTDKVYDRAIVINFNAINEPFAAEYDKKLEPVSYEELVGFFEECQNNPKLRLTKNEEHAIYELLAFLDDTFEIKIGNRIFNQIELFVPVFVGLGGERLDAIDMMISAKIFRKLDLVFIMDMADSLIKLQRFLNAKFGKDGLPLCRAKINSLLRKYQ